MDLQELMKAANENARTKGFWDAPVRTFGDQIALMHSELSEALEHYRDDASTLRKIFYVKGEKPDGVAVEFADVIIRIADTCEEYGIPLVEAIEKKMGYNKTRPYRHGNKSL